MRKGILELIQFFVNRLKHDEIGMQAGALAYTTVLALIPAVTIVLSIFAMVPAFTPLKEEVMRFASENFLPVFTDAIVGGITNFVSHAASMTLTGSLMLIVISLMLIRAVDKALNRIWRGGRRKATMTFAIYWTLLTVGPLSLGVTVWVSTKLIAVTVIQGVDMTEAVKLWYYMLPVFVEIGMMFTLYIILPVADVKVRDALIGSVLCAGCFEVLKRIFSAFILNFSDYQAIYGAIAAIPVLMIWIYLNWWLVLIGAEFTAFLGEARGGTAEEVPHLIESLINVTTRKKIRIKRMQEEEQRQHDAFIQHSTYNKTDGLSQNIVYSYAVDALRDRMKATDQHCFPPFTSASVSDLKEDKTLAMSYEPTKKD